MESDTPPHSLIFISTPRPPKLPKLINNFIISCKKNNAIIILFNKKIEHHRSTERFIIIIVIQHNIPHETNNYTIFMYITMINIYVYNYYMK